MTATTSRTMLTTASHQNPFSSSVSTLFSGTQFQITWTVNWGGEEWPLCLWLAGQGKNLNEKFQQWKTAQTLNGDPQWALHVHAFFLSWDWSIIMGPLNEDELKKRAQQFCTLRSCPKLLTSVNNTRTHTHTCMSAEHVHNYSYAHTHMDACKTCAHTVL